MRHHRLLIRSVLEALKLKDSLGVVDDSLDRLGILTPKTARETLDGKGLEGGSHVGGLSGGRLPTREASELIRPRTGASMKP